MKYYSPLLLLLLGYINLSAAEDVQSTEAFDITLSFIYDSSYIDRQFQNNLLNEKLAPREITQLLAEVSLEINSNLKSLFWVDFADKPANLKRAELTYTPPLTLYQYKFGLISIPFSHEQYFLAKERASSRPGLTAEADYGSPAELPALMFNWNEVNYSYSLYLAHAEVANNNFRMLQVRNALRTPENNPHPAEAGVMLGAHYKYDFEENHTSRQALFQPNSGLQVDAGIYYWVPLKAEMEQSITGISAVSLNLRKGWENYLLDLGINQINSSYTDRTLGIEESGSHNMLQYTLKGGYRLWNDRIDLFLSLSAIDNSEWNQAWERQEVTLNIFIDNLRNRLQFSMGKEINIGGNLNEVESFASLRWFYRFKSN